MIIISGIGRLYLCVLLALVVQSSSSAAGSKVAISVSKATVLIFDDAIDEVELGSSEYVTRIKGKFLLIRAKRLGARPTFLFVRYGQGSRFCNVEISASNAAPLEYRMSDVLGVEGKLPDEGNAASVSHADRQASFLLRKKQGYYTYSKKDYGVRITLVDIEHFRGNTYLKFHVKNSSSIDVNMEYMSFNYYDVGRRMLFFSKRVKSRLVEPIVPLPVVQVGAFRSGNFVFCIPTVTVNGGLEVCFGEANEGRTITMNIPGKVLLSAKRRL